MRLKMTDLSTSLIDLSGQMTKLLTKLIRSEVDWLTQSKKVNVSWSEVSGS